MSSGIEWRYTVHNPTVFGLDARVLAPLVVFFLHMSAITFYIAILGIIFFLVVLKWKKLSPLMALDSLRFKIAGKKRSSFFHRRIALPWKTETSS